MPEILDISRRVVDDYFMASSLDEAIGYLTAHNGQARVIGGGTWLMPQMQRGESRIANLVDVSRIAAMRRLVEDGGWFVIGGAVTFARLTESDPVRLGLPLLYQAARAMGTPGVRRLATLAGNVVSAVGNAHGAVALLALDAEAEIANLTGAQWLPVSALFVRSGVSRVNVTAEIVTAFRVRRAGPREGYALAQLPAADNGPRASLLVAAGVALNEDMRTIARATVAAGWAGNVPLRVPPLERALQGLVATSSLTEEALLASLGDVPIGSGADGPVTRERRSDIARLAALAVPRAMAQAASRPVTPPA